MIWNVSILKTKWEEKCPPVKQSAEQTVAEAKLNPSLERTKIIHPKFAL